MLSTAKILQILIYNYENNATRQDFNWRLMTEYGFVVVQITKINAHVLRFFRISSETASYPSIFLQNEELGFLHQQKPLCTYC